MSQDDANTHPTESAATSADTEAFTTTSELKKEPIGELTPDSTPTLNQESVVVVAATGTSEAVDPPGEITSEDLTRVRNPIKEDYLTKKDDALETNPISPSEKPGKYIAIKEMASDVIVSSSKKSRPPYKFDPDKITLRFLFANRDGLTVTVECKPTDTVGEVKGALISAWPEGASKKSVFLKMRQSYVSGVRWGINEMTGPNRARCTLR